MTPALVRADLAALLASDEIDLAIKSVVVENVTEYAEVATSQGLSDWRESLRNPGAKSRPEVLEKMAQGNVSAQLILLLLKPHLDVVNRDQLFLSCKLL